MGRELGNAKIVSISDYVELLPDYCHLSSWFVRAFMSLGMGHVIE